VFGGWGDGGQETRATSDLPNQGREVLLSVCGVRLESINYINAHATFLITGGDIDIALRFAALAWAASTAVPQERHFNAISTNGATGPFWDEWLAVGAFSSFAEGTMLLVFYAARVSLMMCVSLDSTEGF